MSIKTSIKMSIQRTMKMAMKMKMEVVTVQGLRHPRIVILKTEPEATSTLFDPLKLVLERYETVNSIPRFSEWHSK